MARRFLLCVLLAIGCSSTSEPKTWAIQSDRSLLRSNGRYEVDKCSVLVPPHLIAAITAELRRVKLATGTTKGSLEAITLDGTPYAFPSEHDAPALRAAYATAVAAAAPQCRP